MKMNMKMKNSQKIITVTLNPAIDRVIEVAGLQPGGHQIARTVVRSPGGKGVNVSRTLEAFGLASTAMGFLGRDNRSQFAPLFESGLIADAMLTLPGWSRENITLTDTETGKDTHLRDAGLSVGVADVRELTEQLAATIESGDVVVFSGSLPPGVEHGDFAEMLQSAGDAGAKVAVDSSGQALEAVGKQKKLWLIKPNSLELSQLIGRDLPTLDYQLKTARGLSQKVEFILLSCGEDGAYLITREETFHAFVKLDCDVVNTVGCGDVLLGGFLAAMLNDQPAGQALAIAVAAATACAAHKTAAKFDLDLFEELCDKVELKPM